MKSIFGRINIKKELNNTLFEKGVKSSSNNYSVGEDIISFENEGFGQVCFNTNSAINITDGLLLISDSRLDNSDELINLLQLKHKPISDDELILKSFVKWGDNCVNYLIGDFAFVIWDSYKKKLFCARDHFGVKPLFYYVDNNVICFASEIKSILSQGDLNFKVDDDFIADHLSIIKSEKNKTTFSKIKKIPPGTTLKYVSGKLEIEEYWKLKPQKTISLNENEIIKKFKDLFISAVKCRIDNNLKVGAELSGGIDSSSITAIASQFCELTTFSHILPDQFIGKIYPFKDEKEYIHNLTDFCSIKNKNLITSETGILDALIENLHDFHYLSQQSYSTFSDHLYKKANEKNVTILLSGFGGDEVVTSSGFGYLNEVAHSKKWKELKFELKNRNLKEYEFLKYFTKVNFPTFYKYLRKIRKHKPWWFEKYKHLALNQDFSEHMQIKNKFYDQYNDQEFTSLQQKNINRITHTYVSHRLEYSAIAARKLGIEYRYPLLDKRLIEFYLSIPGYLKSKSGIKRYPIREAMKGILPETIRLRNDKSGATIPTVFMRFTKDKHKIENIILKAKSNKKITKYIDIVKYEKWFKRNLQGDSIINPGAFYNYLKLILFIEQNPSLFE